MFDRIGRAVVRAPLVVIAAWIAFAAVCLALAPSLSRVGSADESSFLPGDVESVQARHLGAAAFPDDAAPGMATLVFHREGGLTDADSAYRDALGAWLTDPATPEAIRSHVLGVATVATDPLRASQMRSEDGTTELATVRLDVVAFQPGANEAVDGIRAHAAATAPSGLGVHVTGSAGIGADYVASITEGTDRTTIVTIFLVILILLAIYRAPLAALVPLITIGVAFLVSRGLLGWMAESGVKVSTLIESFVVVLVFGVGTDYTIFLVSRYREELARTPDGGRSAASRAAAAEHTVARIGAVIAASAATVIVGLVSLAAARFGLVQTIGPAMALAIGVTLAAGLTLAPALLVVFGPALFWPRHPKPVTEETSRSAWDRLAAAIVRRPVLVAAAAIAVLAIPVVALPAPVTSFDMLAELPPASDARVGFERVAEHMDRGRLMPVVTYVDAPGTDLTGPAGLAAIAKATEAIAATDGVASVRSLVAPTGVGIRDDVHPSKQLRTFASQVAFLAQPGTIDLLLAQPDLLSGLTTGAEWLDALGASHAFVAVDPGWPAATDARTRLTRALTGLLVPGADPAAAAALKAQVTAAAGDLSAALGAVAERLEANPDQDWFLARGLSGEIGAQVEQLIAAFVGPDGHVARITTVVTDDPYSSAATETVGRIRAAIATLPPTEGLGHLVGGPTAEFADIHTTMEADFRVVAVLTILGILLVLMLLLRSIVAPLYLVASVLLVYVTTLHLSGALFQGVLGHPGMNTYLGLIVFVLLVALGSDYNIFVTSRIREESAVGDLRAAIRRASARTGAVVAAAGIILAGTFGSLMTAPLMILFQIGAAVALGVLIVTLVVGSILVPALAAAVGEWSWWPSRRREAVAPSSGRPSTYG
ncbi:MAG: MMPL family transporter [Chloroflexota bacterium]